MMETVPLHYVHTSIVPLTPEGVGGGLQSLRHFMVALLWCEQYTCVPFPAKDVVRKIEQTKTGAMDRPEKNVVISECGVLPLEEPFTVDRE